MIMWNLTKTDVNNILALFDLAVKQAGLQAAPAAVVLTEKLQAAIRASEHTDNVTSIHSGE